MPEGIDVIFFNVSSYWGQTERQIFKDVFQVHFGQIKHGWVTKKFETTVILRLVLCSIISQ